MKYLPWYMDKLISQIFQLDSKQDQYDSKYQGYRRPLYLMIHLQEAQADGLRLFLDFSRMFCSSYSRSRISLVNREAQGLLITFQDQGLFQDLRQTFQKFAPSTSIDQIHTKLYAAKMSSSLTCSLNFQWPFRNHKQLYRNLQERGSIDLARLKSLHQELSSDSTPFLTFL